MGMVANSVGTSRKPEHQAQHKADQIADDGKRADEVPATRSIRMIMMTGMTSMTSVLAKAGSMTSGST